MITSEQAIDELTVMTLGMDADPKHIQIFRAALAQTIQLAVMEHELNRAKSLLQVRKAMSDEFEG